MDIATPARCPTALIARGHGIGVTVGEACQEVRGYEFCFAFSGAPSMTMRMPLILQAQLLNLYLMPWARRAALHRKGCMPCLKLFLLCLQL